MAVSSGFFNSDKDTPGGERKYSADDFGRMFDGLILDGIFSTYGREDEEGNIHPFEPTLPPDDPDNPRGFKMRIGVGRAWFNHHWILNDSVIIVESEIGGQSVIYDRIDAIVLEVNENTRVCEIKWIDNTEHMSSETPTKPTMKHEDGINQYALCYIYVEAGSTEIKRDTLENHGWESVIGHDETPFVTGILQQASVEQIMQSWIESWETHQTEDLARFRQEFDTWFAQIQNTLDEDAAGNLANHINDIWTYLNNIGTAEEVEY